MKKNQIEKSKKLIKNDKVVAFPTETVYGLGANADSEKAIKKIFEIKGRPISNPLIVHIDTILKLKYWSKNVPIIVYKLALKFWPGPITIVIKKKKLQTN